MKQETLCDNCRKSFMANEEDIENTPKGQLLCPDCQEDFSN